jgi:4-hydroxythreonine-4-phosphate dehydrogenase
MRIALTLGDPGGIGPEIVAKTLAMYSRLSTPSFTVFGSREVLDVPQLVHVLDLPKFKKCAPDAQNGRACVAYIEAATKAALALEVDAIVTAPISKTSLHLARYSFTGHTTLLKNLTNSKKVSMAFYSPKLKTILATVHKPLSEVPKLLNEEVLETALKNGQEFMRLLKIANPKIALAGLNPHAGEGGLFGREEIEILEPFVKKHAGALSGPYPPDTLYYRAANGDFDLVISLYHDQGLIPLKLIAFDEAVNVTLGLPFIRTSPDHGTAFEKAWKNDPEVSTKSFKAAVELALKFSTNPTHTSSQPERHTER